MLFVEKIGTGSAQKYANLEHTTSVGLPSQVNFEIIIKTMKTPHAGI